VLRWGRAERSGEKGRGIATEENSPLPPQRKGEKVGCVTREEHHANLIRKTVSRHGRLKEKEKTLIPVLSRKKTAHRGRSSMRKGKRGKEPVTLTLLRGTREDSISSPRPREREGAALGIAYIPWEREVDYHHPGRRGGRGVDSTRPGKKSGLIL